MPQRNDNITPKDLAHAIREHLSPHAVALIAAKLQVSYCGGPANEEMKEAEQQCQWFATLLIEMFGTPGSPGSPGNSSEYEALCNELGW